MARRDKLNRAVVAAILFPLFVAVAPSIAAQATPVTDGVNWLVSNQDPSGLWGTAKGTPFRDAAVVLSVLGILEADSAVIDNGLSAINSQSTTSTDYLARRIIAIASSGDEFPSSGVVENLANMQNEDGGWGYQKGYGSNVLETALALRALKSASYSNMTKLGTGVNFLKSQANADSAWAFVASDSSRVFYTAHVIISLAMLQGDFSVSSQIRGGVNWLKTQAHGDGGFGTGGISNPYETGLAMAAIVKGDPLASEIADAQTYLDATQLPDGSWNGDAYSTAMAIYGLVHVGPDLAVNTSDIVLSNPAPSDYEVVTISATIHNRGALAAHSILVHIFDGDPGFGGVEIGADATIWTLAAGGDSTIEVEWDTHNLPGDHDIYVLVDPLDEIQEPDELNNTAAKPVHVYFPPDLIIASIIFDPPEPDPAESVIIRTTVKNTGEVTANNVSLQIWDGDPDAGGIPLLGSPYNISSITPGSQFTLNLNMGNYFSVEGNYPIYACADVDGTIREVRESNNCGNETLWIGIQSRAVALNAQLNLLGLPLVPKDAQTSFLMTPQIPTCNEIDGWDRVSQKWISAVVDTSGGLVLGDDFAIELRDGFFARATAAGDTVFRGMPVRTHGCTYLERGLNVISVPDEDACYSAYSLIDSIDACVEAYSWDGGLQSWKSAVKISEGVFIGEDFPVTPGNGYFVKVNAAGSWCTSTCDTFVNLPDLLVTPADIWIEKNPVVSGDTVGIFVNINNIGTVTAYSPRLDIYAGNPDQGGSPMGGGNVPDIPAGGSSGYYGNYFVFTGSGFVDIYGIADYYNTILELNETNNRAYKTLQVLPGMLISKTGASGGESILPRPVGLLKDRGGESLVLNHELTPVPVRTSASPSVSNKGQSAGRTPQAAASSSKAAKIENVLITNHSSSSVAVTWTTDAIADGCVHYGPTPALGLTKCEDEPGSEIHRVVLGNLSESTPYYFEVVSGGITDDNQGDYYSFTTTKPGAGVPSVIYGRVIEAETNTAGANILVTGTLRRGEIGSYPLSGMADSDGMWVLNLGNLKSPGSSSVLPYEVGDTIVLEFQGGSSGVSADTIVISGTSPQDCGVQEIRTDTAEEKPRESVPFHHYLSANYPNPFNPSTTIKFGLPVNGHVELFIYNIHGQQVVALLNGDCPAGNHEVIWTGLNANGEPVSSGVYFYRLKSGKFVQTRKMVLLK